MPDTKTKTLEPEILNHVQKDSTIHSDEWHAYKKLSSKGYTHKTVNHGAGEYVNGETHVNSLEGYWSYLKRSIRSTHITVSAKHLERYSKEFEYRWNSRKDPQRMFPQLISTFCR